MTRQSKTPADRAQAALDVAIRRRDKLAARHDELRKALKDVEQAEAEHRIEVEYLAKSPHLKQPVGGVSVTTTTTAGARLMRSTGAQGGAGPS